MNPTWSSTDGLIRLYLSDCREVLSAIASSSIDLVVTDPPYGHNNNNGDLIHKRELVLGMTPAAKPPRPIVNDGPEANDLVCHMFSECARLLKAGCCCCCCCGGGGPDPQFARWSIWMDDLIGFKQMVVWDKGPMGMGWHYRRSYETILVGQKPGAACRWCDHSGRVENIIRPNQDGIRKIIPTKGDHPTPKPVALAMHFIRLHSYAGDIVLDPFMGRGWVGVAAARMGRRFVGVEIDAEHFYHAVKRIENALASTPLFDECNIAQSDMFSESITIK